MGHILLVLVGFLGCVHAQSRGTYKFVGTVVDVNGEPVAGADVTMTDGPGMNPIPHARSGPDGRFSLTYYMSSLPEKWQIFVSAGALGWSPIGELFFVLPKYDAAFAGRPFVAVTDQEVIDVGAVPVQFWYERVKVPLRTEGRALSKDEWRQIWCVAVNKDGKIIGESSLGGELKEVDLQNSELLMSFPEGQWQPQFRKFEFPNKLSEDILGTTKVFTVKKGEPVSLPQLSIKLKDARMKDI
ncbi:MAG: carboxypeptidase-like regulatory domain-containing protein [Pyrinomonadaceae bacterium]